MPPHAYAGVDQLSAQAFLCASDAQALKAVLENPSSASKLGTPEPSQVPERARACGLPIYIAESVCFAIREQKIFSRMARRSGSSSASEASDSESQDDEQTHRKFVMYGLKVTRPGGEASPKIIFRRYQDFEELNNMLPSDVAQAARLPGRRLWARIMGSRFSAKAIQERHAAVTSYLQRVLNLAPEIEVVQMFICDDWLSRDTPGRTRQFARLRAQKRRLELLIAEREAEIAKYHAYLPEGTLPESLSMESQREAILAKRRAKREYRSSPLNPKSMELYCDVQRQPELHGTSQPTADQCTSIFISENRRVRSLRMDARCLDDNESDDVLVRQCAPVKGTPARSCFEKLPRAPISPVVG